MDHSNDPSFEIERPRNTGKLYSFFINYKFASGLKALKGPFPGRLILDLCCGSGMGSEIYANRGMRVIGVDYSLDCIKRARIRAERYRFSANFLVSDGQQLPFKERSFDYVAVHDGLHHLREPCKAVREMCRVAQRGILVIEPGKSLATSLAIRLGISLEYEGDDFVYRLNECEVKQWLMGTTFGKLNMRRYAMYYPHKPNRLFRLFDSLFLFAVARAGFFVFNFILGKFGNKLQAVAFRPQPDG